jgi:hypothetical protein
MDAAGQDTDGTSPLAPETTRRALLQWLSVSVAVNPWAVLVLVVLDQICPARVQ